MDKDKLTHGSLFSGIGGFDLAAEKAGLINIFHCEIENDKREVLQKHFKNCKSYGDINDLEAEKYRNKIDVLTGGFPCQDISIAQQSKKLGGQKALKVKGLDYGKNMRELYGKLNLEQSSLKTAQCSLFEVLKPSYATFTSSGMMLNGDVFSLPTSDTPILGKEFMVLPTPVSSDGKVLLKKAESYKTYYQRNHQDKSLYQFQLNGLTANQAMKMYEWMMGFPRNWIKELYTDSETQSFQ